MEFENEAGLKRALSSGQTAASYFLFGDDSFLIASYTAKLAEKTVDPKDAFNYQKFTGEQPLQSVYDAAVSFPMLAEKKCVILKDFDFEKCDKADFDKLCSLLSLQNDRTLLIYSCETVSVDPKKSDRAKKLFKAVGSAGGKCAQLNHRTAGDLNRMLITAAQSRGCTLKPEAARRMVENIGEDIRLLQSELEKVCAYRQNGEIDPDTVEKVCIHSVEQSVYNLSSHILKGDAETALEILSQLFFLRIKPMILFSTVSAVYVDLYRLLCAKAAGVPVQQLSKDFSYGSRSFTLNRTAAFLKHYGEKKMLLCFRELTQTDKALKRFSGKERVLLEEMVVRLAYIAVKGEAVD